MHIVNKESENGMMGLQCDNTAVALFCFLVTPQATAIAVFCDILIAIVGLFLGFLRFV